MMGNKTVFQQKLEELKRAGEEKRLRELQAKYPNPNNIDYGNMNLRNELQTRFDLNEMNNLSTKLGAPSGLAVGNDNGAPVQDLSQRLSGNDKGTQNGFYAALGKPTPKIAQSVGNCSMRGFANKFNELKYMSDVPHTISTGNQFVDKNIAKYGAKILNSFVKDPKAKFLIKGIKKAYPYIEDAGAGLARIQATYAETCKRGNNR